MADHPVVAQAVKLHNEAIKLHSEGKLEAAIAKLDEALATGIWEPFRTNWIKKDRARYRRELERMQNQ